MIYRCVNELVTREMGFERTIDVDTVWYVSKHCIVNGGYECADLIRIENGVYAGDYVRVRASKLLEDEFFESVPLKDCFAYVRPGLEVPDLEGCTCGD